MSSINFSPMTSIFENKSAGTIIVGMPGSGKTFFLLNLCANATMLEQRIFAIDPKNDLGVLTNIFPNIEYIDINNVKDSIPGALDPFRVFNDLDTNTLTSIISIICGGLSNIQITAITPILNDFVNKLKRGTSKPTFSDVVDYLYSRDNENAQIIGTKLQIHKDSKYGSLLFGESDENFIFDKNSKIISVHGMDLPKAQMSNVGESNLTEEQKFNSGIVFIICKVLKNILTEGKYPTLFIMDEAHIAYQNPSFSTIINEFLILGRSLNVATILASQSVKHYPEDIAQLVASKFCFKSSSKEAELFLNSFLNQNPENAADFISITSQISQFETGNCFFVDSENRSGIFKVTSLLSDDITSNPLNKKFIQKEN